MQVKFEESGTPLKRSKNRKGETSEEMLRRMCKNIANDINNKKLGDAGNIDEFMEHVYDIEWTTYQDKSYKSAAFMVAGGGPTIWVCLLDQKVKGYWGSDRVEEPIYGDMVEELDNYCEEMYGC